MSIRRGILYIVATPIGNLEDLSTRAQRILGDVDLILAEDTRHSRRLLQHFGIATPVKAYHDHNERQLAPALIQKLLQGTNMALISDAGMPLISDPGYHLVRAAHRSGAVVVSVPGPCALVSALSIAGFPADRFVFEGYLPSRASTRRQHLESLRNELRTMVFYEAPHRVLSCLSDMAACFGRERPAAIARELTKQYENVRCDSLGNLVDWLKEDAKRTKGEFVLILEGAARSSPSVDDAKRVLDVLLRALPLKQAVLLTEEITRVRKNELYGIALQLKRHH